MPPELFVAMCEVLAGLVPKVVSQVATSYIVGKILAAIQGELSEAQRSELERKVGAFFQNGLDYLDLARRAPNNAVRIDALRRARGEFISARNDGGLSLKTARSAVYVGSCSAMLGEEDGALHFYELGYQSFMQLEEDSIRRLPLGELRAPDFYMRYFDWSTCLSVGALIGITKMDRRKAISVATAFVASGGTRVSNQFDSLYSFMRPLCTLLHSKGSTLTGLAKPSELTIANVPVRRANYLEKSCGVTLK